LADIATGHRTMSQPSTLSPALEIPIPSAPSGLERFPPTDSMAALARKVAFLRRRTSYPSHPRRVEAIQTHMSWVFLTDDRAYKLKKPVVHEVLDFGTVEARRRHGARELRLNRRLAPGVYLGLVPLTVSASGRLHLGGGGEAVEWLVEMRRLPRDASLDRRIRNRCTAEADLRTLGSLLGHFYQRAPVIPQTLAGYRERLEGEIRATTSVLEAGNHHLPRDLVMALACAQMRFLHLHGPLFEARLERVVEGHGDLRPEHVFFVEPGPMVVDCLEFDRELRILDPADELAYLSLECARLGVDWMEGVLFAAYAEVTGDEPPPALIHFYKCHRAFVRAKIAYWHLRDVSGPRADRWVARAQAYLSLAADEMVSVR
jgi:uncharacterized protein